MRADSPRPLNRPTAPDLAPEVIARAAGGDAGAFDQICAHTAPRVRRYVGTIVWNPWDAEDVTQDVLVKIFIGLGHYVPERATFTAWTLRVARNAAIDHMRRHRVRPEFIDIDQWPVLDDAGRWCRESLRQVLGELSQSQREILVLRAFCGFEPSEVAGYTHASRGSINTLYHRARVAARDRLRAMEAGPCTRKAARRAATGDVVSEAA